MKTIGYLYGPDVSLLPIGGKYTMDIEQAVIASQWLNSDRIIPMHYNTFNAINVDIVEFTKKIEEKNKTPIVINIGDSIRL